LLRIWWHTMAGSVALYTPDWWHYILRIIQEGGQYPGIGGQYHRNIHADTSFSINLKCDPQKGLELREHYNCVQPGYHMNKKHWNTILVDGSVTDELLREWIDQSYNLIVLSLTKSQRALLD